MFTNKCSICFNKADAKLDDVGDNNIKWSIRLQCIVPEVEWHEYYSICSSCISDLKISYAFREMCLNLLNAKSSEEYVHFKEDYDSDVPSVSEPMDGNFFICYHCKRNFDDIDSLTEHIGKDHNNQKIVEDGEKKSEHDSTKMILRQQKRRSVSKVLDAKFHCSTCKTSYKYSKALEKHEKVCCKEEAESKPISCEKCNTSFKSDEDFAMHVKQEHQDHIIRCTTCDESFISDNEYLTHRRSKHREPRCKDRSYSCDICYEQFKFVKDIIKHYSISHSIDQKLVRPYSCDICGKRFRASTNLNNHKRYHEKSRMNICSICGNSFKTKGDLLRHETLHLNERNHKCDQCDKAFKTADNLRFHCLIVHTDQSAWKFVCHECGKRFPQKSGYEQHRKRHLGEKSFKCTRCSKAFITKNELQKHMFHHSDNMKYSCDQCGKEIKHKKSLEVHLARTHGIGDAKIPVREKKHACEYCAAKFCDKSKLIRHVRIHTGIKPFACSVCNKTFNDNSYLKQHLKNFHQITEDSDGLNDYK